jgi:histidinol dehydrogenase
VISYSYEALQIDGPTAMEIADREGLWAHSAAVGLRLDALAEFEAEFEGDGGDV